MILEHTLSSIEKWLHIHPEYGFVAAFFVAFIESLAIIGSIVPGSVTMTMIGTMIGTSLLPLYPALISAISGAFIGDLISFYIGYCYQDQVRSWPWVKKHQSWLKQGEIFINKYGIASIIIGRFFGPMRSMVPMVAGLLKMRPINFMFAALPSAMLWSVLYLIPGVILGVFSLELPNKIALDTIIASLGFLLIIVGLIIIIKKKHQIFQSWAYNTCLNLAKFLNKKLIFGQVTNNKIHAKHVMFLFLSILSISLFLAIAWLVTHSNGFSHINHVVYYTLQNMHLPYLNGIILFSTFTADKYVLSLLILGLCALWLCNGKTKEAIFLLVSTALSVLSIKYLKLEFHIARPPRMLAILGHTSFPSGHVSYFSFLASYLYLRFRDNIQALNTKWPFRAAIATILYIALTRLYCGAHWLSDILGGIFLGLGLACICLLFLQNQKPTLPKNNQKIGLATLLIWLVLTSIFSNMHYKKYYKGFFDVPPTQSIAQNNWIKNPKKLPSYRNNRFGHPQEIFNLQWAQHLPTIKKEISHNHWTIKPLPTSWVGRIMMVLDHPELRFFPKLPRLYNTLPPILIAYKKTNNKVEVLRLWRSEYDLLKTHTPIYIGTIYEAEAHGEKLHRHYSHRTYQNIANIQKLKTFKKLKFKKHTITWLPLKLMHWPITKKQQVIQIYT